MKTKKKLQRDSLNQDKKICEKNRFFRDTVRKTTMFRFFEFTRKLLAQTA